MTTKMTRWIGPDPMLSVGNTGFLIEHYNELSGGSRFELRDTPPYTNQSHQPRLSGWCGTEGVADTLRAVSDNMATTE